MVDQVYIRNVATQLKDVPQIRHLTFSGAKNFRDLGGYQTIESKTVRWGVLYRSDGLHKLTDRDIKHLSSLSLNRVVDFRAEHEKEQEPDRLPGELLDRLTEIPILDSSTQVWHDSRDEFMKNLRNFDPATYMIQTNVELATRFTPEMSRFLRVVLSANGQPVLFHCAAGKDRTGFAAAILLRILGVPQEIVMKDYLLTNKYLLRAYQWKLMLMQLLKGKQFVSAVKAFMDARAVYLDSAFEAIYNEHDSFENFARNGLRFSRNDVDHL